MASPKHHFYFLHSPLCKNMSCLLVLTTAGKTLKSNSSLIIVVETDTWRTIFFWTSCSSSSPNLTHAREEATSLIHQLSEPHAQQ